MEGFFFFFQAEDGIRDGRVTGVQTCALPISKCIGLVAPNPSPRRHRGNLQLVPGPALDRKSTRLNSSHPSISYAVFCLKKKKNTNKPSQIHQIKITKNHIL